LGKPPSPAGPCTGNDEEGLLGGVAIFDGTDLGALRLSTKSGEVESSTAVQRELNSTLTNAFEVESLHDLVSMEEILHDEQVHSPFMTALGILYTHFLSALVCTRTDVAE
jgi:hypothetical protein